jgi:uncharacterized protein
MAGINNLNELLSSMSPKLNPTLFTFCSVQGELIDYVQLKPLASFVESEGLTLILEKQQADKAKIEYQQTYQQITLTVHSSLEAVGLTAAFANKLAEYNISANVVAGYYHDHLFVQTEVAQKALSALQELQQSKTKD